VLGQPDPGRTSGARAGRWVTYGVVVALLAGAAVYLSGEREELSRLGDLSIGLLLATGLLQVASQLFLNASFLLPLKPCVTRLGFWELHLVRTGGLFVGSLVPVAGGLAVRLAYLRTRGLTYLDFTWATLLSNVLALHAAAVLAVVAAGVLWVTMGTLPWTVIAVSGGVLGISLAMAAAFEYLPRWSRHPRLTRWRWLSDMKGLTSSRSLVAQVFGWSLLRHVANFVTFGLLYRTLSQSSALGAPGDGPEAFLAGGLVYALTSPIRMVNVTPGNLGLLEWVVALVGSMVQFDVATGLIVSLAFRGIALVAQGLVAAFGAAWMTLRSRA
jgi:uncharacterized membrane protein YbhN (UPF0104 family)